MLTHVDPPQKKTHFCRNTSFSCYGCFWPSSPLIPPTYREITTPMAPSRCPVHVCHVCRISHLELPPPGHCQHAGLPMKSCRRTNPRLPSASVSQFGAEFGAWFEAPIQRHAIFCHRKDVAVMAVMVDPWKSRRTHSLVVSRFRFLVIGRKKTTWLSVEPMANVHENTPLKRRRPPTPLISHAFRIFLKLIPGSSFGRKKVPDLNPAKCSAGFRKKRRRPEKTSGSKILKNRDDKRLDHTQANCLCATSSFFWNALIPQPSTGAFPFPLPSPIFRMA